MYIAQSLDGYIARKDEGLDWLENFPHEEGADYGYGDFYEGIGVVLMGRKTYDFVRESGAEWPYANCSCIVLTRNKDLKIFTPNTVLWDGVDRENAEELRNSEGKDIWVVGGGRVISDFLSLNLIDEILVTIVPVMIGEGIPLFGGHEGDSNWALRKVEPFSGGILNIEYSLKA